jgi:hypothetical protein
VPAGRRDPDRDLLVHGPRALVWGGLGYASNWGYGGADLAWRRSAADELAAGHLTPESVAGLRTCTDDGRRTIYAVRRGPAAATQDLPGGGAAWTRVFANDAMAIDRLDPAPRVADTAPGSER